MKGVFVRVLSLRSSVIHGFVTEPWHSLHVLFLCECAVSSVLEPRTLLSACLVLCWSVVFGSRHSCLEFRFRVGVRTLALHVLSHCVSVRLEFARPRALLSTCVVVSGFCHFGLVLFMVLWQSLDTPFMSCFYVSARLRVCSSRALSCCLVLCWSVVFGSRHSCLEFRFRVGVRTLALHVLSHCVSVRLEFARPRALLSTCVVCVVLHAVRVFIGCVHSCYVCCVARSSCFSLAACFYVVMSCVNTQLMSVLISCVFMSCFAHGWWFVLLAMCLCFRFVWAHGFCLSFLCAMCSHVNCLDPTHLVTWLLVNLPHLCFPHYPPHLLPL